MLQKFTLTINLDEFASPVLQSSLGRQFHALLFAMLADIDPELAENVHGAKEKPFAMWVRKLSNKELKLDLAAFETRLCTALQQLATQETNHAALNKTAIIVKLAADKPTDMQKIWENAGIQQHSGKLRINFLTPTSFRRLGIQVLFPEPTLLFKNVYAKAMAYGDAYLAANIIPPDEFTGQIYISRYELATKEVNYDKYKIIGCMGYAVYDYRQIKASYIHHSLAFLSALAEYTGIGYKTTMGLGKVVCTLGG